MARHDTADKLSDPDRAAILAIASTALAQFLPKDEATPKPTEATA